MIVADEPFVSYAYSYPHKLAYRELDPAPSLADVWSTEDRRSLFFYVHIPFCEFRCGFCNLFATVEKDGDAIAAYLRKLSAEMRAAADAAPDARFVRFAVGGGTPTVLTTSELEALFDEAQASLGVDPAAVPAGCEASPATADAAKLALLRDRGFDRISLGVQTFDDEESKRLGRPQTGAAAHAALDAIRDRGFPVVNVDLIYGIPEQSPASFLRSLDEALRHDPEEIYLYPLYVRELTGLGRIGASPSDDRLSLYRAGRDRLLERGYEQISLRMFRRASSAAEEAPAYCCQSDGMVGVGCGARSYAGEWHYSADYATSRGAVRAILASYLRLADADFRYARHGYRLDADERRRRYVIQSLLQRSGLDRAEYASRFGEDVIDRFPEITALVSDGYALVDDRRVCLTQLGIDFSDAIGPALYSDAVRKAIAERAST